MAFSCRRIVVAQGAHARESERSVEANHRPPNPNPEAWWELGQAVLSARTTYETYGKVPWIKAGETILKPEEVLGAYEFFKNHGHGEASES